MKSFIPRLEKECYKKRESAENNGEAIIIMDIPLLFESKFTELVDKTLLVYVDEDIQLQRLMERNIIQSRRHWQEFIRKCL